MANVLDGIKVVEVAVWAYVPSAGTALAEWGAEVIKVEPPTGDPIRGLVNAGIGAMDGIVFPWEIWNRGKKVIALDLTKPEAQDIVLRLCEDADVFLTSYLPAARQRLGFDIDAVRERNASIIYACGTGQGSAGPDAERVATTRSASGPEEASRRPSPLRITRDRCRCPRERSEIPSVVSPSPVASPPRS
jgi:crotonobetainyl-CoA:carnitine CoA-transferase CaiB-like acyl-CoA transferase